MSNTVKTVECEHCQSTLEVTEHQHSVAESYANGAYVCADCEGRRPYPEDVPECDIADCEMPAPFTVNTEAGPINRCREDLRRELTGESWNDWRFYNAN